MKRNEIMAEVPVMTLRAITKLLTSKEGVDISPIVKDLEPLQMGEDLTFLNVALVMKGMTPEIPEDWRKPRWRWGNQYKFESYSLILNEVIVTRENNKEVWPLSDWLNSSTEEPAK